MAEVEGQLNGIEDGVCMCLVFTSNTADMEWRLVLQLTRDLKPILLNLLILGGQEEEAGEDFGQGLLLVEHWDISLEVAEDSK